MSKLNAKLPLTGGVNLLEDESALQDDETVLTKNMIPVEPGMMGKRKGWAAYGNSGFGQLNYLGGNIINGGVALDPAYTGTVYRFAESPTQSNLWIAYTGTALIANPNIQNVAPNSDPTTDIQTIAFFTPDAAAALLPGAVLSSLTGECTLMAFNGKLYLFAGDDLKFVLGPDGVPLVGAVPAGVEITGLTAAPFVFNGLDNEDAHPRIAFPYRFRVLYGDFGGDLGSYLVFSDDDEPATVGDGVLSDIGRRIQIGARDSDRIVAGTEVMMSGVGSVPQSAALILKRYSAYLITGEITQSTEVPSADNNFGFADLSVARFNVDCGCASSATLVHTPYGILWASHDNVWLFQPGQVPIQVGNKIAAALKNSPPDKLYRWHAGYFGGFYRLAIFSADQDAGTDITSCGEQWWLDLRTGAPTNWREARWYGPQVYKPVTDLGTAADFNFAGTTAFHQHRNTTGGDELLAAVRTISQEAHIAYMATVDGASTDFDFPVPLDTGVVVTHMVVTGATGEVVATTAYLHGLNVGDMVDMSVVQSAPSGTNLTNAIITAVTDTSFTYTSLAILDDDLDVFGPARIPSAYMPSQTQDLTIDTDLRSKLWDMGEPLRRKAFVRSDLDVEVRSYGKITETLHKDGGASISAQAKSFLLGSSQMAVGSELDDNRLGKDFQVLVYQSDDRDISKMWRIQLTDEPGFLVTDDNKTIAIVAAPATPLDIDDAVTITVTLTTGWYATYYDLIQEVAIRLTLDGGADTVTHNVPDDDPLNMPEVVILTNSAGLFIRPLATVTAGVVVWNWLGFTPVALLNGETLFVTIPQNVSPFWALNPGWQFDSLSADFMLIKGLPR